MFHQALVQSDEFDEFQKWRRQRDDL